MVFQQPVRPIQATGDGSLRGRSPAHGRAGSAIEASRHASFGTSIAFVNFEVRHRSGSLGHRRFDVVVQIPLHIGSYSGPVRCYSWKT